MAEEERELRNLQQIQSQTGLSTRQPLEVRHLSHDLRGPLNSILGFADLLLEGVEGPLNEIQREDVSVIRHSAQNLLALINTIVDLSQLDANGLKLDMTAVPLAEVVQAVLNYDFGVNPIVELAGDTAASLPVLQADRRRVEQIMLSVAHVLFEKRKAPKVTILVDQLDDAALIQMNAVGVLIPAEQLEELFELGCQIDGNGRSKLSSGGVELPLVQQLVVKQGGEIWAQSNEKLGTTFFIKLPLYQSNQSANQPTI